MINPNENIILKEIKYYLLVLEVLGLFPRFIDYDPRTSVSLRLHDFQVFIIIGGVLISIHFFLFVFFSLENFHNFSLFESYHQTETINQFIELSFGVATSTLVFYLSALNAKNQFFILNDLLLLDRMFVKFNTFSKKIHTSDKYSASLIILPFVDLFFSIQLFIQWKEVHGFAIFTIVYYIVTLTVCLSHIVLIMYFLKVVTNRMKILNSSLCVTRIQYPRCRELIIALSLREKICDIVSKINAVYGFTFLLYFAYGTYTITAEILYLFDILTDPKYPLQSFLANVFWILTFFFILYYLSAAGSAMSSEAKKTAEILSRAYGKGKDYQNIIDKFLTKSIRQETKFTAYGFFVIDNSTLFKIISAVTTYLVILIQFKQLEESKND